MCVLCDDIFQSIQYYLYKDTLEYKVDGEFVQIQLVSCIDNVDKVGLQ